MRWYQPVPALSWSAVSAALVERRVLGYALAGAGVQLSRAEQTAMRSNLIAVCYCYNFTWLISVKQECYSLVALARSNKKITKNIIENIIDTII